MSATFSLRAPSYKSFSLNQLAKTAVVGSVMHRVINVVQGTLLCGPEAEPN